MYNRAVARPVSSELRAMRCNVYLVVLVGRRRRRQQLTESGSNVLSLTAGLHRRSPLARALYFALRLGSAGFRIRRQPKLRCQLLVNNLGSCSGEHHHGRLAHKHLPWPNEHQHPTPSSPNRPSRISAAFLHALRETTGSVRAYPAPMLQAPVLMNFPEGSIPARAPKWYKSLQMQTGPFTV